MPTLFRTICSTDWKGRPSHSLLQLATGPAEELLAAMDADVLAWQRADMEQDHENAVEDAEEAGQPPPDAPTEWQTATRWEMDRKSPTDPRVFAEVDEDGGRTSVVYHFHGE